MVLDDVGFLEYDSIALSQLNNFKEYCWNFDGKFGPDMKLIQYMFLDSWTIQILVMLLLFRSNKIIWNWNNLTWHEFGLILFGQGRCFEFPHCAIRNSVRVACQLVGARCHRAGYYSICTVGQFFGASYHCAICNSFCIAFRISRRKVL